jgi:hypothetical protein
MASVLLDVFILVSHVFGAFVTAFAIYNHSHFCDDSLEFIIIAVNFLFPLQWVDLSFCDLLLVRYFSHQSLLLFVLISIKEVDLSFFNFTCI